MRTKQLGNLFKLTRLGAFNSFVVQDTDGLTIIDTNLPGSANEIVAATREIGEPVQRIVITHAHGDHASSLDDLSAALPDADIIVSQREAALLAGDMHLRAGEPDAVLRGGYVTATTTPTITIQDGDMVGSLQVIASPGHTPGHISLLDTRDNSLIVGDAYVTQFGTVVAGKMNLLFPFPAMATWHKPTALESARKLLALQPSRLATGHGPVLDNPIAKMQAAVDAAAKSFPPG